MGGQGAGEPVLSNYIFVEQMLNFRDTYPGTCLGGAA